MQFILRENEREGERGESERQGNIDVKVVASHTCPNRDQGLNLQLRYMPFMRNWIHNPFVHGLKH